MARFVYFPSAQIIGPGKYSPCIKIVVFHWFEEEVTPQNRLQRGGRMYVASFGPYALREFPLH